MKIGDIFDVFSRRNKPAQELGYSVPKTVRARILMLCRDVVASDHLNSGNQNYSQEFWTEIHQRLLYQHGRVRLTQEPALQSVPEELGQFLVSCGDEEFLDFVEHIFKTKAASMMLDRRRTFIADINTFFAADNIGFELTDWVKEEVVERVYEYPFFGREAKVIKTLAYPQIIRKDSQAVHELAIVPALTLLSDPIYKSANQEFLAALDDYKRGDYRDCLAKCGSCLESVLKILCSQNNWSYRQDDTASRLIGIVRERAGLDTYFDQPLMIIATLRNRLSSSHGAGVETKTATKNIALFALNSTATAIVFLVSFRCER